MVFRKHGILSQRYIKLQGVWVWGRGQSLQRSVVGSTEKAYVL